MSTNRNNVYYCQQKELRNVINQEPLRFTPENPYSSSGPSKKDLDRRRKAEILQYSGPLSQQINNKPTKRQQYLNALKSRKSGIGVNCPIHKAPTSSSDVPGPTEELFLDTNVGLYNYQSHLSRSFDEIPKGSGLIPPYIILNGDATITIDKNSTYIDPGAYSYNGEPVTSTSHLDITKAGTYQVIYSATDMAGVVGTATRTIHVIDKLPPTISLQGETLVRLERFSRWNERQLGGVITNRNNILYENRESVFVDNETITLTKTIELNNSVVGNYFIEYSLRDDSGNVSEVLRRTIEIVDTTPPVLELAIVTDESNAVIPNGSSSDQSYSHVRFQPWVDPGVVLENISIVPIAAQQVHTRKGVVTLQRTNVDTSLFGNQVIQYTATDEYDNTTVIRRYVNMTDNEVGEFDFFGNFPITLVLTFEVETIEPEMKKVRAIGNNLMPFTSGLTTDDGLVLITHNIDVFRTGSYEVEYKMQDDLGQIKTETKYVVVLDINRPVIEIVEPNPFYLERFTQFVDPGVNIMYKGEKVIENLATPGTYEFEYENSTLQFTLNVEIPPININSYSARYQAKYSISEVFSIGFQRNTVLRSIIMTDTKIPEVELIGRCRNFVVANTENHFVDPGIMVNNTPVIEELSENRPMVVNYIVTSNSETVTVEKQFCDYNNQQINRIPVNVPGEYSIQYIVSDELGNSTSICRNVHVIRFEVSLHEDAVITIERFSNFSLQDPGVIINDHIFSKYDDIVQYGFLLETSPSAINTDREATFELLYRIQVEGTTEFKFLSRTVIVEDTEPPQVVINQEVMTIPRFSVFIDPGIIVNDISVNPDSYPYSLQTPRGEIITIKRSIQKDAVIYTEIPTHIIGTFIMSYEVKDDYGNQEQNLYIRKVNIVDTIQPKAELVGEPVYTFEIGDVFIDPGIFVYRTTYGNGTTITQSGNYLIEGENVSIAFTSNVNTSVVDNYSIQYNIADEVGNVVSLTRVVNVVSRRVFTMRLVGNNTINIPQNTLFVDPGVAIERLTYIGQSDINATVNTFPSTLADSFSPSVPITVIVDNIVNTNISGLYTLTYKATENTIYNPVEIEVSRDVVVTTRSSSVPWWSRPKEYALNSGLVYPPTNDADATEIYNNVFPENAWSRQVDTVNQGGSVTTKDYVIYAVSDMTRMTKASNIHSKYIMFETTDEIKMNPYYSGGDANTGQFQNFSDEFMIVFPKNLGKWKTDNQRWPLQVGSSSVFIFSCNTSLLNNGISDNYSIFNNVNYNASGANITFMLNTLYNESHYFVVYDENSTSLYNWYLVYINGQVINSWSGGRFIKLLLRNIIPIFDSSVYVDNTYNGSYTVEQYQNYVFTIIRYNNAGLNQYQNALYNRIFH